MRPKNRRSDAQLRLECLEDRLLLAAVNPGELALLTDGDQLFFVQGHDTTNPSDGPGPLQTIVIATFTGPGSVQFYDSTGGTSLENGEKIGNIEFTGTTEASDLRIWTGRFLTGFSMTNLAAALLDQPDDSGSAVTLTVPAGETGATATFNTGRAVVASLGEDDDWYQFAASEFERIVVSNSAGYDVEIFYQYSGGSLVQVSDNVATLGDENANATLDTLTVFLHVPAVGSVPYTMMIDRVKVFDAVLQPLVPLEDLPNTVAAATNLGYVAATQVGIGAPTPAFTLKGEHQAATPSDFFRLTLQPFETLLVSNLSNVTGLVLTDPSSNPIPNALFATGQYQNTGSSAQAVVIEVVSSADWSFDVEVDERPLSSMVEEARDATTGDYVWGNVSTTPWMNTYIPAGGGSPVHVFAPAGSGGAVVTGNMTWDASSTGFGRLWIDGSLKGQIGMPGATLGLDETLNEVIVGYVNGQEGGTTGGVYLGGNLLRFWSRTNIGVLTDAGVDVAADVDTFDPAEFRVAGFFMDMHASGTIFANIEVHGLGTPFDIAHAVDDVEFGSDYTNLGIRSSNLATAFCVDSPTGNFTVSGNVRVTTTRSDPQDWYVFHPQPGQKVTVTTLFSTADLATPNPALATYVYDPSDRLVGVVNMGLPLTFTPDVPGAYYLVVGLAPAAVQPRVVMPIGLWSMTYTVQVEGSRGYHLGTVRSGSALFGSAVAANELGDDVSATHLLVGYANSGPVTLVNPGANFACIEAAGAGVLGNVDLVVSGSGSSIMAGSTSALGPATIEIDGDLDYLGTTGDMPLRAAFIEGSLGVWRVGGDLTGGSFIPGTYTLSSLYVGENLGALIVDGNFYANLEIGDEAHVDLFYVGGNFGGPLLYSSLVEGFGADIAYAFVGGTIYDQGHVVTSVTLTGASGTFVDDGGASIVLTPVVSEPSVVGVPRPVPTITYRYLPVAGPGGAVGAVLTQVTASDSVRLRIPSGRAHIGFITFGNQANSFIEVTGGNNRAELDLGYVTANGDANRIINNTFNGDLLRVQADSLLRLEAKGHIGISDRFALNYGPIPNPTPGSFAVPAVQYVFVANPAYANGVLVTGDLGRLRAQGSVGDVYVGGILGDLRADSNRRADGTEYTFRGMHVDPFSWDGLAGVAYAGGGITYIDPGAGLYGGQGAEPVGGIFTAGVLTRMNATDALIQGPVMASGGITQILGTRTVFSEATIGAGADFSDWAHWDRVFAVAAGVRLNDFTLKGAGSGVEYSQFLVGVLNNLTLQKGGTGLNHSSIYAIGDLATQEGVNRIRVQGGGIDATDTPPWGGLTSRVIAPFGHYFTITPQRIGTIEVTGTAADIVNAGVYSLKTINRISAAGDIVATAGTVFIEAPLGTGRLEARNILGPGSLYLGTAQLDRLTVRNNVTTPELTLDGRLVRGNIGGGLLGLDFIVRGPSGELGQLVVGNGIAANIWVSNFITLIDVKRGDVTGVIQAGGANARNFAIDRLIVRNGSLLNDVSVVPSLSAVRPGGGINNVQVRGDVTGNITTTSFYRAATDTAVTAHIQKLQVTGGEVSGDITIQRNNPADPNDPGGDLKSLDVRNAGGVAVSGAVTVAGRIERFTTRGDVTGPIYAEDGIGTMDIASNLTGPVTSDGAVSRISVRGNVSGALDLNGDTDRLSFRGNVTSPAINVLGDLRLLEVVNGELAAPVSVAGDLQRVTLRNRGATALSDSISAGGNFGSTTIEGNVVGADLLALLGTLGPVNINGNFTDSNIDANALLRVRVRGVISDPVFPFDSVIHAATGSFTVSDNTQTALVSAGSPAFFAGVTASVS